MEFFKAGVEGWIDKAVVERLFRETGSGCRHEVTDYRGCVALDRAIPSYLQMTRAHKVFLLRDLDRDACAPNLRKRLGIDGAVVPANIVFRVPVRQVEAWLLADREGFARHFRVAVSKLPRDPEGLDDAKAAVLEAVRHSTSSSIREGMLPRQGFSGRTGAEYPAHLVEFVRHDWNPERARLVSDSLDRCLRALGT